MVIVPASNPLSYLGPLGFGSQNPGRQRTSRAGHGTVNVPSCSSEPKNSTVLTFEVGKVAGRFGDDSVHEVASKLLPVHFC